MQEGGKKVKIIQREKTKVMEELEKQHSRSQLYTKEIEETCYLLIKVHFNIPGKCRKLYQHLIFDCLTTVYELPHQVKGERKSNRILDG